MNGKEVLRAIADGADPSEFEWLHADGSWADLNPSIWKLQDFMQYKNEFRRKPRTRVVNGFTVPAPIQEMPKENDVVWFANWASDDWSFDASFSRTARIDQNYYRRGLLFSTQEAAIANAKAMCGINPNA